MSKISARVEDGYYQTPTLLIDELQKLTRIDEVEICDFQYSMINHKVTLNVRSGYSVSLSKNLRDVLGTSRTDFINTSIMDKCVDVGNLDKLVYIYSNVIEGGYHMNTEPNLLKILNTSPKVY